MSWDYLWAFEVKRKHWQRCLRDEYQLVSAVVPYISRNLTASIFHLLIIFVASFPCVQYISWTQWRRSESLSHEWSHVQTRVMNDQMYKQNRRVLSTEYGPSSQNQRPDKIRKQSSKRSRSSSGDFLEYQSLASESVQDEPFLKRFCRTVAHFVFSQVSDIMAC